MIFAIASAMPQSPHLDEPEDSATTCTIRRCSMDYNPICGVTDEGESCVFTNICYMSNENCDKPEHEGKYFTLKAAHYNIWNFDFSLQTCQCWGMSRFS